MRCFISTALVLWPNWLTQARMSLPCWAAAGSYPAHSSFCVWDFIYHTQHCLLPASQSTNTAQSVPQFLVQKRPKKLLPPPTSDKSYLGFCSALSCSSGCFPRCLGTKKATQTQSVVFWLSKLLGVSIGRSHWMPPAFS